MGWVRVETDTWREDEVAMSQGRRIKTAHTCIIIGGSDGSRINAHFFYKHGTPMESYN
jgi:hypothetical protein